MAKETQHGRTGTPKDYALTTPAQQVQQQYSHTEQFILPIITETQRELGRLTQAVATLTEDGRDNRKKLDRITNIMYAVGVVGTILLSVLVFLANKIADALIAGLKNH